MAQADVDRPTLVTPVPGVVGGHRAAPPAQRPEHAELVF